jgi:hypothetical protein
MEMTEKPHFKPQPEAVDRDPSSRPGVPMYKARTTEVATNLPIEQQPETVPVFIGVEVGRLTPVFGTAVPPRGLSGLIRRKAYNIPEHSARRWMLLMLGDRVDIWESRIRRHPFLTVALIAGAVALSRSRDRDQPATRRVKRVARKVGRQASGLLAWLD